MTSVIAWIVNTWWKLVFWWKKRTGWIDFKQEIAVHGVVVEMVPPDVDGDRTFNLKLEKEFEHYITLGDKMTTENKVVGPSIHCEIPPWAPKKVRDAYDVMKVGDRVCVIGAWGFDGVHLGTTMWLEIPAALLRHQPNVKDGWFEIHPVRALYSLEDVASKPNIARKVQRKPKTTRKAKK
jgi:hypothetical protein